MTVKSIIDIDLDDTKFKAFKEEFDKYQNVLSKMPGVWGNINKESKAALDGIVAAMFAQTEAIKAALEGIQKTEKTTERTEQSWLRLAHSTKSVAGNIKHATESLLKWTALTGVVSGLLGAGGLFGLDTLAASVSGGYRSATGLGTTYGQKQAFDVSFRRLTDDPDALLAGVNAAIHDPTQSKAFAALGLGMPRGDTVSATEQLLRGVKQWAGRTPSNVWGTMLGPMGLSQMGISLSTVENLASMSWPEFNKQEALASSRAGQFGRSGGDQRAWQDFQDAISTSGTMIENVFVHGLRPLLSPLQDLSKAVAGAVGAFLGNKSLKTVITDLSADLESFAKTLGTADFKEKIKTFADAFGYMADKVLHLAKDAGFVAKHAEAASVGAGVGAVVGAVAGGALGGVPGAVLGAKLGATAGAGAGLVVGDALDKTSAAGAPKGAVAFLGGPSDKTMALFRKLEGSGDSAVSPKGAIGRYQIEPGTAREMGYDPSRLKDPAYNTAVARAYLSKLMKEFHNDLDAVAVAYNWGPGNAEKWLKSGRNNAILPAETRKYLAHERALEVKIFDATGGNVHIASSQLPQ